MVPKNRFSWSGLGLSSSLAWLGLLWPLLASPWPPLGFPWALFGPPLGLPWPHLRRPGGFLGPLLAPFGVAFAPLGVPWAFLGRRLGVPAVRAPWPRFWPLACLVGPRPLTCLPFAFLYLLLLTFTFYGFPVMSLCFPLASCSSRDRAHPSVRGPAGKRYPLGMLISGMLLYKPINLSAL